ncbi:deoxycytidyl transferase [Thoreauomyces humboldtii]|nr:deoxycytidyl transferase [Thoreauomyces humboldtii]
MAFPGGFSEYMFHKRRKLEEQGQEVNSQENLSSVLVGVIIYFNGYLGDMTYLEWRRLVLQHGALVRDRPSGDVTHIIATQMTESKKVAIRKPVLTPNWLLDSISAGRQLPTSAYRLYTTVVGSQQTLATVSSGTPTQPHKTSIVATDTEPPPADEHEDNEGAEDVPEEALTKWGHSRGELNMQSEWVKANISTAPGFLQRYFSRSRLHHLSTWKSDLRDFVAINGPRLKPDAARKRSAGGQRVVMHVDMDCFFASVALKKCPELKEMPVAVAHGSGNSSNKSTAEIASCNYAARAQGVKNGMMVHHAQQSCKDLQVLPYEFEEYDRCSKALYTILLQHGDQVQAVSCDEAYLEVSSPGSSRGFEIELADIIRREILEQTGCNASIGIGSNMLVARMATGVAKPNGVHLVPNGEEATFMASQSIRSLPGVGKVLTTKLERTGISDCGKLANLSIGHLQRECGGKTGTMLYNACRGMDTRQLENKPRQSVGAEINWGMRFQTEPEVEAFMLELSEEVEKRMRNAMVKGRLVTVKVKRRRYEGEPHKILGCGDCDNLSKSSSLAPPVDSAEVLFRESWRMLREMQVPALDIRGIGIHVQKLEGGAVEQAIAMEQGQRTLDFRKQPGDVTVSKVPAADDSASKSWAPPVFKEPLPVKRKLPAPQRLQYDAAAIDMETLRELPKDVQAEIISQLSKARGGHLIGVEPHTPAINRPGSSNDFLTSYASTTASQVDPEYLNALPPEIRKEMELEMRKAAADRAMPSMKLPVPAASLEDLPGRNQDIFREYATTTVSQADPEYLNALPDDIRRELERDMRRAAEGPSRAPLIPRGAVRRDARGTTKASRLQAKGMRAHGVTPEKTTADRRPATIASAFSARAPIPTLGGYTNPEDVRVALSDWVDAFPRGPEPSELAALQTYFDELVSDMRLDTAEHLALWLLDRVAPNRAKGKGSRAWADAARDCLAKLSKSVEDSYGCPLKSWKELV